MITHSQINIHIQKEPNEDGTISVILLKSSTIYSKGRLPTGKPHEEFGRKVFKNEKDADEEIKRLNEFFADRPTDY